MNSNDRRQKKDADVFVLGLTGGIGTGKSTAAEYLTSKGFIHIDADAIGRELTADGSPVLQVLDDAFSTDGCQILRQDGSLDRKALADIVFGDRRQKDKLDDIMFSRIGEIIRHRIDQAHAPVLLDAPLLFEAGLDHLCDRVILICCDLAKRLRRVAERDNISEEEISARIRSQMPDGEKKAHADYIVDNSGSLEELHTRLNDILYELSHLDKR